MRVCVKVNTEHEVAEGSSKAVGEVFILHAPVKRKWDGREEWEKGTVTVDLQYYPQQCAAGYTQIWLLSSKDDRLQ